jgi:hypothetical protein
MPITLHIKSVIVDSVVITDTDIAAALNTVTYTNIYGVSVILISNTRARIMVTYD